MRLLIFCALLAMANCESLKVKFSWKEIDYDFTNESMRKSYIDSGDFVPGDVLPSGVATWKDKMFVTVARWKKGVPATLNYVPLSSAKSGKSPKLVPYPNWEINNLHSDRNDSLISIFRVRVDECDRLWGIDMGLEDVLGKFTVVREKPRVVIIDLKTDKIIRTHVIMEDVRALPNYVNLVVDSKKDSCDNAFAYIADINDPKILVYSFAQDKTWSFRHPYFSFEPLSTNIMVSGLNFHWVDAIFGMALSPAQLNGSRTLYFHAFASQHEFQVSTDLLKNQSMIREDNYHKFSLVGFRGRDTQSTTSVMDPVTGILYMTQINRHGLACWASSNKSLRPWSFRLVVSDPERLSFPCDVNMNLDSRELYVLQSNVPKLMFGKLKEDDKIVVYSASLDVLSRYCAPKPWHGLSPFFG